MGNHFQTLLWFQICNSPPHALSSDKIGKELRNCPQRLNLLILHVVHDEHEQSHHTGFQFFLPHRGKRCAFHNSHTGAFDAVGHGVESLEKTRLV